MRKILLISDWEPSPFGGIARHCYNILKLFEDDKDIEIEVVSKKNVRNKYIKYINKTYFSFRDLFNIIKKSNCDAIHIHGFASLLVVQAFFLSVCLGKKIIYTAHFHPFYALEKPLMGKIFFYIFIRPFLKRIQAIITLNDEDTVFFSEYNSCVYRIPHWIPYHNPIFVNKKKDMLLFIGRTDSNKGIQHLYTIPLGKYEVHCVTKGSIERCDFVVHNNISDEELKKLYGLASLVIVPSKYEAFSYVALESLISGTPILVSDRVRIVDYLNDCGGVTVFRFGDYVQFNEAISAAIVQEVDVGKVLHIFGAGRIKEKLKFIYTSV